MSWNPATAPYANPTMPPWRGVSGPAKSLRVLLICTAAFTGLLIIALITSDRAYNSYRDGDSPFSSVEDADAFVAIAGLIVVCLTLAIFVLTIVWQWRLAKNHELLGRPGTTFGPGWAIGAWFIPFANLVIPILQFKDLWKGSEPGLGRYNPAWKRAPVAPVLWVWWGVFALSYLIEWGSSFQVNMNDEFFSDTQDTNTGGMVAANVLRIVAAILFIIVVKRLTERQERAFADAVLEPGGWSSASPAWPAMPAGGWPGASPAWPAMPGSFPPYTQTPGYGAVGPPPIPPPPDLGPGWKPDPLRRAAYRYWDGSRWTDHAATNGQPFTSPL